MARPSSTNSHLTVPSKPFDRNWTAASINRHLLDFQATAVPHTAIGPAVASATEVLAACAAFAAANRPAGWVEEEEGFSFAVEVFVNSSDDGAEPEEYAFCCVRALATLATEVAAELGLTDLDAALPRLRAVLWHFTEPYFASDLDLRPFVVAELMQTLHDTVQQHEPERAIAATHAVLTELATDTSQETSVCETGFDPLAESANNKLAPIAFISTIWDNVPFPTKHIESTLERLRCRREALRTTSSASIKKDLNRIDQRIAKLQADLERFEAWNDERKHKPQTLVSRHIIQL